MKLKISKAISVFMIICIVMASSNVMCFAIAAKDYGWPTTNHTFIQKKENGFVHDISVSKNTEVYAIADGTVECKQVYTMINNKETLVSYGNYIVLTSKDGKAVAKYAHLNKFVKYSLKIPSSRTKALSSNGIKTSTIHLGKYSVKKGDLIGYSGTTGNSSGPHLHFELWLNGKRVNPPNYLPYGGSKPLTPKISSVSATADNEITVKWNSVSGAEKYILQGRKAGDDYQTIAEITGTSYTHKKLNSASLYWYHVKSKNSAGTSGYSDASAAYTKPSTPTTSIISTSSIKVSWSGSGGNTSYELLARKAGDADYTTIAQNINGYTYTHSGLEAGTQYYYKIKAHNNEHTSVVSARSDAGYGYTKLNSPWITGKTSDAVSLNWSRGVLNGDYSYTYRIRRKTSYDADYTNIAVVSNSSYTDYNLQPNTTYRYYVDVLRNGIYCVRSETVDVTTDEQPATQIALSTAEATLTPGQTYQLYATVLPENTTNKSVTWTSSNYDVAEV